MSSPTPQPVDQNTTPWGTALCVGVAVALATAPVAAIVSGTTWLGPVLAVIGLVVAAGVVLHRLGLAVSTLGQAVCVLALLTSYFSGAGMFGVIPGPAAFGRFGQLLHGAGEQIGASVVPVAPTPEISFLLAAVFGLVTIAVYVAAVGAGAPAAAGVPLLAVFAVPAALTGDLLPWWSMVAAAAGFGLLLVARRGARRQLVGGVALVALATAAALGIGAVTGFVGTAGRFGGGGAGGGSSTGVGLSPFAALRGQLTQSTPVELMRVRGLPRATYLRALTLRDYSPEKGWQVTRPEPGPPLPGTLAPAPPDAEVAAVAIENVALHDYWLPLYGVPLAVGGLPAGRWSFDEGTSTGYTARPRAEQAWTEQALLGSPTAAQLRAARGDGPGAAYLSTARVDPRVIKLAKAAVGDAPTAFDKAIALQKFFTGPQSGFTYDLRTAPSGGDDALVEFLTVGKQGFCEQYASAMAVMLRAVGVPARVAIGFTGGTDEGDHRSVSTSDAHAWVEAWFPGAGWTAFDPTPLADGRTITPPYVAEALAADGGQVPADPAQAQPAPSAAGTAPGATPPADDDATPPPPGSEPDGPDVPVWPFLLVAALGAVLATPAVLRRRARRRRLDAAAAGGSDAAGAAWAELLAESADRGVTSTPSDTVRGAARRLVREHELDDDAQQALRQVVSAAEASWYGDGHPVAGQLTAPVAAVRESIAAHSSVGLKDRLLPPSVLNTTLNPTWIPAALRRGRPSGTADGTGNTGGPGNADGPPPDPKVDVTARAKR